MCEVDRCASSRRPSSELLGHRCNLPKWSTSLAQSQVIGLTGLSRAKLGTVDVPTTIFANPEELGQALAAEIADGLVAATAAGRRYVLGCPGGRSPRTTYQALAQIVQERRLDLSRLVIAMMDDYAAPDPAGFRHVDDAAHFSCRRFARDEIAGPLNAAAARGFGISDEQIWLPDPGVPAEYDDRLRAGGGIDLFILASGASDGHVGFNPPGTPADSRTRIVLLAESTRKDNLATFSEFGSLDEVPEYGVTVGVATITELSRRAVMVIHGEDKRTAAARLRGIEHYDPYWPATLLGSCRNAALYVDQAAVIPARQPARERTA